MTFWEHFIRLLVRRPKPALAALYWHLTRRKVRARNRLRVASADLPFAYMLWIAANEKAAPPGGRESAIESWSWRPRFSVFIHSDRPVDERQFDQSLRSVEAQLYPCTSLVNAATGSGTFEKAICSGADFVVLLRAGDTLSESALFRFGEALQRRRDALILYGDQDEIDERGHRSRPWFKPRWNEEMFLAQDFLSPAVALEADLARMVSSADPPPQDMGELMLAATSMAAGAIVHVPYILCHLGYRDDEPTMKRLEAVARHLRAHNANCVAGPFETVKVQWPLPSILPTVSIIVPTKDKVELLRPCVDGVLNGTDYDKFELLVVDNGSTDPRTLEFLGEISAHPKVRILPYAKPYNFSAINNFAAGQARGSFLCLLNNDTEILEPAWLLEMMRYAVRPHIGAVGAKLLYEDGSIQHAGVVVGIGDAAGHAHRFLASGEPGYFRQPHVAHYVSAVTAACLVVDKQKFNSVGGLDAAQLAVAFNDVDFCLKLEAAGWRNVYVPHAVLIHHESKSRGNDISPENFDRYQGELKVLQERWGTKTYEDPLHNPNLDRYTETFVFRL